MSNRCYYFYIIQGQVAVGSVQLCLINTIRTKPVIIRGNLYAYTLKMEPRITGITLNHLIQWVRPTTVAVYWDDDVRKFVPCNLPLSQTWEWWEHFLLEALHKVAPHLCLVKDHILNVITSCDVECSSNCEDPAITGASLLLHGHWRHKEAIVSTWHCWPIKLK